MTKPILREIAEKYSYPYKIQAAFNDLFEIQEEEIEDVTTYIKQKFDSARKRGINPHDILFQATDLNFSNRTLHGGVHAILTASYAKMFGEFYSKYFVGKFGIDEKGLTQDQQNLAIILTAAHDLARTHGDVDHAEHRNAFYLALILRDQYGVSEEDAIKLASHVAHKDRKNDEGKSIFSKIVQCADCAAITRACGKNNFQIDLLNAYLDTSQIKDLDEQQSATDELISMLNFICFVEEMVSDAGLGSLYETANNNFDHAISQIKERTANTHIDQIGLKFVNILDSLGEVTLPLDLSHITSSTAAEFEILKTRHNTFRRTANIQQLLSQSDESDIFFMDSSDIEDVGLALTDEDHGNYCIPPQPLPSPKSITFSIAPSSTDLQKHESSIVELQNLTKRYISRKRIAEGIAKIEIKAQSKINLNNVTARLRNGGFLPEEERDALIKEKGAEALFTDLEKKLYKSFCGMDLFLYHCTTAENLALVFSSGNLLDKKELERRNSISSQNSPTNVDSFGIQQNNIFFSIGSSSMVSPYSQGRRDEYLSKILRINLKDLSEDIKGYSSRMWTGEDYADSLRIRKKIGNSSYKTYYAGIKTIREKSHIYERCDGTKISYKTPLKESVCEGRDTLRFLAYNFIEKLRYLGGSARQYLLENPEDIGAIEQVMSDISIATNSEICIPTKVDLETIGLEIFDLQKAHEIKMQTLQMLNSENLEGLKNLQKQHPNLPYICNLSDNKSDLLTTILQRKKPEILKWAIDCGFANKVIIESNLEGFRSKKISDFLQFVTETNSQEIFDIFLEKKILLRKNLDNGIRAEIWPEAINNWIEERIKEFGSLSKISAKSLTQVSRDNKKTDQNIGGKSIT